MAQKKQKTAVLNANELMGLEDGPLKKIANYLQIPDLFRFVASCTKLYNLFSKQELELAKNRYILRNVLCLTNRQTEKSKFL